MKEKNLKVYKMVSIVAIIAFFPIGIFAFYTSMKLEEEYYAGIERGRGLPISYDASFPEITILIGPSKYNQHSRLLE